MQRRMIMKHVLVPKKSSLRRTTRLLLAWLGKPGFPERGA